MKNIILFLLFIFIAPLSIEAQNTPTTSKEVASKKVKKTKKSKKLKVKPVEIKEYSDITFAVAPRLVGNDTAIMAINMGDSTVSNYRGEQTVVRWQKVCDECFSIRELQRDTLTADSLAISIKRVTLQYDMYEYDLPKWQKYRRLSDNADPKIKALQKEIADKQELLRKARIEINSKKN